MLRLFRSGTFLLWGASMLSHLSAQPAAASKPSFPPILVLSPAEASALPALGDAASRSVVRTPDCLALEQRWSDIVAEVQHTMRIDSREQFVSSAKVLDGQLEVEQARCPAWKGPLTVQRTLLREFDGLYAPTHAADTATEAPLPASVGRSLTGLQAEYARLHDSAWQDASLQVGRSWDAWRAQASVEVVPARKQRYLINLATDRSLVPFSSKPQDPHFAALVRVAPLAEVAPKLGALQGQGPAHAADVEVYVKAGVAEAEACGATQVLFVNVAAPQVPDFSDGIRQVAAPAGLTLRYRDLLHWQDGTAGTPEGTARFARELVDDIESTGGKTLLVVNCNAGLDRSGTTNALVQLVLAARQERRAGKRDGEVTHSAMQRVPRAVVELKRARPSSISSFGRYVFVHRALAAALAAEAQ